jgi:hypothetical protein
MKKLLSVFAAAAMLFGFASCSGDLHDAEIIDLTGYGIRGTMTGWAAADDIPLVDNGDGTYSISFAAQDPEGTGFEKIAVIELGDGSWSTAYRLAQPKSEGDKANVFGADKWEQKVYQGQSADCMLIPAAKGDNVTLLITPSTTYITVKVTVKAGAAPAAPVPYVLSGMFVRGGMFDVSWGAVLAGALMDFTTSTKGEVEYQLDFVGAGGDMGFKVASANWDDGYSGAEYARFTQTGRRDHALQRIAVSRYAYVGGRRKYPQGVRAFHRFLQIGAPEFALRNRIRRKTRQAKCKIIVKKPMLIQKASVFLCAFDKNIKKLFF